MQLSRSILRIIDMNFRKLVIVSFLLLAKPTQAESTGRWASLYDKAVTQAVDFVVETGKREESISESQVANLLLSVARLGGESDQDAYEMTNLIVQINIWLNGISNREIAAKIQAASPKGLPNSANLVLSAYFEVLNLDPRFEYDKDNEVAKQRCMVVISQAVQSQE